ncbi:uncharacterized protein LACBIDRAFT_293835 [Laccaria bicolor S238N-H82]|uniref:Defective in cullin neddylation protein n=1 Tax=Laccaria bicolor (strain S238N-H82 / ATCC MYA-4686) TaxID=486041 RepID=B0D749_LACBS|nr:uncharacterized protein LACBIDRAFT_293835 [Laccaria bicolor S238N-H82]EDR09590.1 predicted protein [Laccaria bicolor S238N-H82]|eukprot:XP_001879939.1 predicted protein [Laccaria bicolor S238N-H82]
MVDRKLDENISQFCAVTGASARDARKFLEAHKRVDVAIDAYYNDPNAFSTPTKQKARDTGPPSTGKLSTLFDKYKDPDSKEITVDGTIRLCEDLAVNPEDVVLLAIAYELKSPRVGEWTKQGWTEGWKNLGMKTTLVQLRDQLGREPDYFQKVYNHTFEFARSDGQRSLGIETAQAFWGLLLPHGLHGGALARVDTDGDVRMDNKSDGWKEEYTTWWFDFLNEKGGKGVSKDTWVMFLDFIRSIDCKFTEYDTEGSWPSTIDDFVEYARKRLASGV